jgi:single-stranded-DNA-specific exonuclease
VREPAGDPAALAAALGVSPLLARLLTLRDAGDPDRARAFLDAGLADLPDPAELTDLERAAARLADACQGGQRVIVHGDYDVDGVVSTALTTELLRRLGASADPTLPHRTRDGYGISAEQVAGYAERGYDLLVCCDCGVTAHEALEVASQRGMDVVVLDHHQLDGTLPPAVAVVDPVRDGDGGPHGPLCAAGVAFMALIATRRELRRRGAFGGGRREPNLVRYLDLVALATVADMVPLVGSNRLLVRHGLRELARRRRVGLAALLDVSGVAPDDPVDASTCGFRLGPRINAAGRLEDPVLALELLGELDPVAATRRAKELDQLNHRRRTLEGRVLDEAIAQLTASDAGDAAGAAGERRALAAMGEGWPPGVLGIVASRIGQRFFRPAVLLARDGELATGSGRSIPGVDLLAAIRSTSELLERHGGHAMAAGLSLRAENFEAFRTRFEREAFADQSLEPWTPAVQIDAELPVARADMALVHELGILAPHGQGNPEPLFVDRGVEVRGVRPVKRGAVQLRLGPPPGIPSIAFRLGMPAEEIGRRVDVVFAVTPHRYRGVESVQLRVEDLRNSE